VASSRFGFPHLSQNTAVPPYVCAVESAQTRPGLVGGCHRPATIGAALRGKVLNWARADCRIMGPGNWCVNGLALLLSDSGRRQAPALRRNGNGRRAWACPERSRRERPPYPPEADLRQSGGVPSIGGQAVTPPYKTARRASRQRRAGGMRALQGAELGRGEGEGAEERFDGGGKYSPGPPSRARPKGGARGREEDPVRPCDQEVQATGQKEG